MTDDAGPEVVVIDTHDAGMSLAAIRKMARLAKTPRDAGAILSTAEDALVVALPGFEYAIPARGQFSSTLVVSWSYFEELVRPRPGVASVRLQFDGRSLRVGGFAIPVKLATGDPPTVLMNATEADVVAAALRHRDMIVDDTGLSVAERQALGRRDRLVAAAAATLASLGVTEHEVGALVDEGLRRRKLG
jgi:hypothetical protein